MESRTKKIVPANRTESGGRAANRRIAIVGANSGIDSAAAERINRAEKRLNAALPLSLEGGAIGLTRDVSASGIFFETDVINEPGSIIHFTLTFDGPSGGMTLKCQAQVLRVEPQLVGNAAGERGSRVGIAAKIIDSKFEARS